MEAHDVCFSPAPASHFGAANRNTKTQPPAAAPDQPQSLMQLRIPGLAEISLFGRKRHGDNFIPPSDATTAPLRHAFRRAWCSSSREGHDDMLRARNPPRLHPGEAVWQDSGLRTSLPTNFNPLTEPSATHLKEIMLMLMLMLIDSECFTVRRYPSAVDGHYPASTHALRLLRIKTSLQCVQYAQSVQHRVSSAHNRNLVILAAKTGPVCTTSRFCLSRYDSTLHKMFHFTIA
ncbi:hypothetical protein G7Y89_g14818 [Cudoniella acicularis]|uniref:Uncharacterized protein n=1 Tax=Cudoniella acicularis TaxID=354080 RepID=A0A8H4VQD8_9HELO|nr:hypothetical protein G7Y89_g14818 [Cudoniella acicularis]